MSAAKLNHDHFAHQLALWINRTWGYPTWENMKFRECRPDVLTVKPTFNLNQIRTATFEVKVSRSDFLNDVRTGKWEAYKAFSSYVYFAVPEGLVSVDEVPDGCGLMVGTEEGGVWNFVSKMRQFPKTDEEIAAQKYGPDYHVKNPRKKFAGELAIQDWMRLAFGPFKQPERPGAGL